MRKHNFKPVGNAFGSSRYYCEACGAHKLDNDPPHHIPYWTTLSDDCDEAKLQIQKLENNT